MAQLLIATTNAAKMTEFQELLQTQLVLRGYAMIGPSQVPKELTIVEETGETFAENAQIKAVAWAQESGLVTLADDSGLCVDKLNGEPGIRSARWAGPSDRDRCEALLVRLAGVPGPLRTAHFVCALCMAWPDGGLIAAEGICEGVITESPQGLAGFGYDPLFLLPELGKTFAELYPEQKNQFSHRAHAVANLAAQLRCLPGNPTASIGVERE